MKYRIRWTENVGYYVDIEAESAEDALEIFEQGVEDPHLVFCEVDLKYVEGYEEI